MNLNEVLHYRRSVRAYDRTKLIDPERIKHYLELATLAPNSSDMQLWEFYHITQPELLAKVSRACLDQKATSTASQIVVFVVRRDWYRKHARFVLDFERENIRRYSPKERQAKRIKDRELYYGKLMPFVYARFFGILGLFRKLLVNIISIFRPMMLEVSACLLQKQGSDELGSGGGDRRYTWLYRRFDVSDAGRNMEDVVQDSRFQDEYGCEQGFDDLEGNRQM